ncbi:hypothetical protein DFS28_1157 [Pseudomonas sp. 478]|nr:hypothetical protein DFS28_1157 [Pseudomonas sp. 478]TCV47611.1 hypothetical protein EDB99_1157 [Pseudomonas sp. 460]
MDAFASKPAPTGGLCTHRSSVGAGLLAKGPAQSPQNQCRLANPVNAAITSPERSCWVICALSSSMAGSS